MKLIQLYTPPDRTAVFDTLDEMDVDYVRLAAEDRAGDLVLFPLPEEGVADVLEELSDLGLADEDFTVVSNVDAATSEHFEELRERYAEQEQDERVSADRLRDRAEDLNPSWLSFFGMAVLSAVVVAAGLLRNSAAAVAGSMVIAPYFGTALSVSVGAVSLDRYLFANGVKHQVVGLTVSIAAAAATGVLARRLDLVPSDLLFTDISQVSIFVSPTALSVLVAVAAGAAGAFTFATATDATLSGVAIAAAIVPSAGAVGLGVAWRDPMVVAGAASLLVINVVCVNATAVVTLLALGNRPSAFAFDRAFDHATWRLAAGAVAGVVLLAAVGGAFAGTAQQLEYDQDVNAGVDAVTDRQTYAAVEVLEVRTEFVGLRFMPDRHSVTVRLLRPPGERYPELPAALERAIEARTGRQVTVHVRYVPSTTPDR